MCEKDQRCLGTRRHILKLCMLNLANGQAINFEPQIPPYYPLKLSSPQKLGTLASLTCHGGLLSSAAKGFLPLLLRYLIPEPPEVSASSFSILRHILLPLAISWVLSSAKEEIEERFDLESHYHPRLQRQHLQGYPQSLSFLCDHFMSSKPYYLTTYWTDFPLKCESNISEI